VPRRSNQDVGRSGEDAAEAFLREENFRIIDRNFRTRLGEIDIIAEEGDVLCFIEVKTRRSLAKGLPAEAVTARKQRQIAKVAAVYLDRYHPSGRVCRFDVISVTERHGSAEAEIVRDAFRTEDLYMI
jgi:putative endonuclease